MTPTEKAMVSGDPLPLQIEFITKLFSNTHLRKKYLAFVVDNLKVWTGCECVGIRVIAESGAMPYEAFVGFSYEFWESENWLSVKDHECVCIRVATGRTDPQDLPVLTKNGSLWTNDLAAFGRQVSGEHADRYRYKCLEAGFATLAVVPIKRQGRVIGLIHLADVRNDMLPEDKMVLLESVSSAIGEAIVRYSDEDGSREKEARVVKQLAGIKVCLARLSEQCSSAIQREIVADLNEKLGVLQAEFPGD